ncbi:hypothetical protein ASZ90_008347 [hydrocarbon metagenome]|uniref:Uncharacterized protein n=1 Tax=hydrocarbon metagenome TaxID=938273 RepID=A0A0W8FLY4_9ZZZZ
MKILDNDKIINSNFLLILEIYKEAFYMSMKYKNSLLIV